MTGSTPAPPLPPPMLDDAKASAPSRAPLVALAAVALVLAGVMGLLWLGARSDANDAAFERDAAITERDAANAANIEANAQLQTSQDQLADAEAAVEAASGATDVSKDATPEELQALKDQVEELSAEVERLENQNAALAADLEAAETTVAEPATTTTEPASTTTAPAEQAPETTVVVSVSPDDIGDQISGLFRRSVLGALQKSCLGEAVLADLGEQRVVEAIASDSPGDDEEFVEAIGDAADACGIDPSAIFG